MSRKDSDASRRASQHAVELFEKYKLQIEGHKSRTRLLTDWGIALHRIGRTEESMALLSKVCEGGVAPAEAFGYLGYGELRTDKLEAAEAALRKGLEIAPADLTMSFYLAKVLAARARKADRTQPDHNAVALSKDAADAYIRAGEIARNVGDFHSAALDGFRALRNQRDSEEALALAVESLRSLGRGRRALLIVEWFLRKQLDHPVALGMKGVLLRDLGKQGESVAVLSSIRATSPDLAWVQAQLALSLSEDPSKLPEALETARKAVDLAPTDWFVRRVLGLLEVDCGEYEAAAPTLAKARELGDASEEVAVNLCRALISSAKYEEAQTELKVLIDAYPRSPSAYYLLGICAEHFENVDRALMYYRQASRLAPDEPNIFVRLMGLLGSEDLRPQASDEIEYRLSGPLRYLALWYRGKFEAVDERSKDAIQTLKEAAQAAEELPALETLPGILVDYGDVLRRRGEYENARAAYLRAYDLDASRQDVCFGKALYHCDVAEFAEARTCVESALKSPREDESQAHLWNLHGWCLQHLGSAREAFKSYEKAFEMSGNKDPWYRKGMANVLMTSDQEKAKEHFTEILKEQKYQSGTSIIVERPSGNVSTVGLLGWCNYRLGQYDEAIRLLESALARSSDNVTVQFDLALAFLASGRTRLALDAYTQGHKITQNCETSRQRGLYYIALFDLVDARRLEVVGAESEKILEEMKGWLSVAGMASENFTWLAQSNNFEISVSESHPGFNH